MRIYLAVLTLLMTLSSGVCAIGIDVWGEVTQPDGTTFVYHAWGDEFGGNRETADGYAFVYGSDGWAYYAELDARGEYVASPYKVGIDDPAEIGIPKNLQRSTARIAEINSVRIAHGYARDPNSAVQGRVGNPAHFRCSSANKCKGYVVLVTFPPETDPAKNFYNGYDQPYGYSWDLFNQFFNGGYETGVPAYTGNIVRQATGRKAETEAVFGSLRAYFDEVYGGDIIEFEILNRKNTDGSPMWLELPKTKYDYADLSSGSSTFWDDAEAAVRADDTNGDVLNPVPPSTDPSPFPFKTAPVSTAATLLANKAIYVYSGLTPTNYSPLHPRVDVTTWSDTHTIGIGARMVMGERQGWEDWGHPPNYKDKEHSVDRFAGIGMHVHEWGHLFGFIHPDGLWEGPNPHPTPQQTNAFFDPANLLGWGSMQSGAHGPKIAGQNNDGTLSHYNLAYRSCPNPYNPFYRMDLGWNNVEIITMSEDNKRIRPGPAHIYVVPSSINGQDYLLDFRTNSTFGQYAGYHHFESSPGLLVWRRASGTPASNPMLIPADGRSIDDARPDGKRDPHDIMFDDLPSDPFGAAPQPYGPTVTEATDATHLRHATQRSVGSNKNSQSANPDPGPSFLAFRSIEITSDSEGAYAEVDIHFIPLPPTSLTVTATPVEGDDNAVTLEWTAPVENGDRILGYQYSTDEEETWLPSLDAEPLTLINSGATITGLADTDLTFQVRTVSAGIAPHNVSAASDAVVLDRPGRIEVEAVEPTHTPPTVDDQLTATLTDANVPDDSWTGITVTWQWQRKRPDDEDWTNTRRVPFGTNTDSYTLTDDDMGHQVRAMVTHYVDPIGSTIDTATSDPVTVNSRPEITTTTEEATNPSVEEDSEEAIYTYTATDPDDGNEITWSLGETNESLFSIGDTTGALTFETGVAPNFEELGSDHPYEVEVIASDGSLLVPLTVTVTVTNLEEIGTVTVSPLPPEVDQELTATLADGDNLVSVDRWTWQRAVSATAADSDWTMIAETFDGEPTSRYTPTLADVGWVLQATAYYADGHGPNKSRESDVTEAVVGPELVGPESLTFVENGEEAVAEYEVSGAAAGAAFAWSLSGVDEAAFKLTAAASQASLSFSEPPNYEMPTDTTDEGGPNTYHVTIEATPTEGASASDHSLADMMAAFQRLSDDSPSAQASSSALTQAVVVTVEDGDDPGVVDLPTGPPRVGTPLTAVLDEEDGALPGTTAWTWQSAENVDGPWTDVSAAPLATAGVRASVPYPELRQYTPTNSDVGRVLRVWVNYEDGFGPKAVASAPTEVVQSAGAVSLTPAQPRVGQPVTARLSGPDEPVTGAAWSWWRREQDPDDWLLLGSSVSSSSRVASSAFAAMFGSLRWGSTEVSSYQPTVADTGYMLQARVSWDGQEAASVPSARVQAGVPCAPGSFVGEGADGTDGSGAVVLSWNTPCDNGSAIAGYEVSVSPLRYHRVEPFLDGPRRQHPGDDFAHGRQLGVWRNAHV